MCDNQTINKAATLQAPTFDNLRQFSFKEVLGGDVARKTIFVLLQHIEEGKLALLIFEKNPFIEEGTQIKEWLDAAKLNLLVVNNIYGNYEAYIPEKFNCLFYLQQNILEKDTGRFTKNGFLNQFLSTIKSTLIYPVTEQHIEKYRRQEIFLIYESAEDYQNITSLYIKDGKFDLTWVYNFLSKKAEAERILLEDNDELNGFVMAPDLKWNGINVENLYLQVVVRRRDIRSVRDLTPDHLPLLENIRDKCSSYIKERYGLNKNQLLMFFHYQPTYYHLHVHIVSIKYEAPGHTPASIFLDSTINNLKLYPDYYRRATLPFYCKKSHPLYQMFSDACKV